MPPCSMISLAMAQAIERSLATPRISPFLPSNNFMGQLPFIEKSWKRESREVANRIDTFSIVCRF